MEHKHPIDPKYHFDELPEVSQEALYAAAAAEKLNEIFRWQVGKDRGPRENNRKAALARVYVLGVILGRWSTVEAASMAGVGLRSIEKAKASFCEVFEVQKGRGSAVKEAGK